MNSMFAKIATDLYLDETYIRSIAQNSDRLYKNYSIKKKDGGERIICQPSPELKTLQYWVWKNILASFPISNSAFAYQKGNSIRTHAEYHQSSNFIFHTDIEGFFPHITFSMLRPVLDERQNELLSKGLWFDDTYSAIDKICFRYGRLTIGAVSSPVISNIVCYAMDVEIFNYCESNGYRYSRYADDIYISSFDYLPIDVKDTLYKLLQKYTFGMNFSKTGFHSRKSRRKVTGVVLTSNGELSIGFSERQKIKKMLYTYLVHENGEPRKILGYLAYLKDIEPQTYDRFITKYSSYCNTDVIDALQEKCKQDN